MLEDTTTAKARELYLTLLEKASDRPGKVGEAYLSGLIVSEFHRLIERTETAEALLKALLPRIENFTASDDVAGQIFIRDAKGIVCRGS